MEKKSYNKPELYSEDFALEVLAGGCSCPSSTGTLENPPVAIHPACNSQCCGSSFTQSQ